MSDRAVVESTTKQHRPIDIINDDLAPSLGLERVVENFTFDPTYGDPSVAITGGKAYIISANDLFEVNPGTATLQLEDGTTNYIYVGLQNTECVYQSNTTDTAPPLSVKIAEVDTSGDSITPINIQGLKFQRAVGELHSDAQTTQTISAADTYTTLDDVTSSLSNETRNFEKDSEGVLKYSIDEEVNVTMAFSITVNGFSDNFTVAVAKNGTIQDSSEIQAGGAGTTPIPVTTHNIEKITEDDTLAPQIKNDDAANNITVLSYNFMVAD